MDEELHTVEEVVEKLGGNQVVAAITGAKYTSSISNWKKIGKFPPKTVRQIQQALSERKARAPDSLWGL